MKKILAFLLSLSFLVIKPFAKSNEKTQDDNDNEVRVVADILDINDNSKQETTPYELNEENKVNLKDYADSTVNIIPLDEDLDSEKDLTISFVGDCTLGRDLTGSYTYSLPYYLEINNYDYSYFFKNVYEILSQDDLTIANLEGPLTDAQVRANKTFAFKGEQDYTNILTQGSVEAVNLANNHTLDYLDEGYNDTLEALSEAQINYFGNGIYEIIEQNGLKIGLAGIKGFDENTAKQEIVRAKSYFVENNVDIIIYNFHWGIEKDYKQNSVQERIARYAVDEGKANLVIGHHPHVLQGIEKYNGVYIVYSLGNFVFGGNKNPSDKYTMIFQITYHFINHTLDSSKINIIPTLISSVSSTNNYQPTIADEQTKELILTRINKNSTNFEYKE